ncbi:peptidoglycan/LPS O-acetylase OafA/YrhL [Krasilnikovia cinnamomea]|uniref:Peptidoglycan/LPS O-acetylase OafA/YrhL n=1 Tax=Krasilnikovia cinnamomea TaxID=349313 RepID=A0A4Q7ZS47_9ACTN|nr:peptidoglycan/LPS O-acetylase OafA/YrhL [Krasilnikovia cinnamomea]
MTLTAGTPVAPGRAAAAAYRLNFRPDIEGLRAVAILTVLGFHAGVPFFAGGYVGVDVFFVVSGFLITGLLLARITAHGTFSLADFYARRARRILPAAGVALAATAAACWLLLAPLARVDVAYDLIAAAFSAANWRFVAGQTDYLAAHAEPSPVLHFWSLAVEEQFYLGWAPVLLLVAVLARRWGRSALPGIAVVAGVVTAGSFALNLRWTAASAPLAYLGSPSRAWQFGVGATAALAAPYAARALSGHGQAWARAVLGWGGVAAIGWATVTFDGLTPYPGLAALVPTLGAAAVILAGQRADDRSASGVQAGRLLGSGPARTVGRLSYTWYLWHWPVLVLAQARLGELGWPARLALVLAAGVPAALTTRLVERPLRFSLVVAARPRRGLAVGATAVVVPLAAALLLGSGAIRILEGNARDAAGPPPVGAAGGPWLLAQPGPARHGGPVRPAPAQARRDFPPIAGCEVPPEATLSPPCRYGTPGARDRIVLIGDSHAGQWFTAVDEVARRRGWSVEVLVKQGCPLPKLTVRSPQLGRAYTECDTWRRQALARLAAGPRPRLIVAASLNRYTGDARALARRWDDTLGRLAATGAPVAYLRDTPTFGRDVPTCVSGALQSWSRCAVARETALPPDRLAERLARGGRPGVSVVDLTGTLCPPGPDCPAVREGVLLYRDGAHLTSTAATVLAPRLEFELHRLGLLPEAGR